MVTSFLNVCGGLVYKSSGMLSDAPWTLHAIGCKRFDGADNFIFFTQRVAFVLHGSEPEFLAF